MPKIKRKVVKKHTCPKCKLKVPLNRYKCQYCEVAVASNLPFFILIYGTIFGTVLLIFLKIFSVI